MMMILSLNKFQSPEFNKLASAGICGGVIRYTDHVEMHDEMHPFYEYLRNYPAVSITSDMLGARECIRTINNGYLFQPIQDSVFKRIISVWREKGFTEALRFAASADSEHVTKAIHWIAVKYGSKCILYILLHYHRLKYIIYKIKIYLNELNILINRLTWALDSMEKGIFQREPLPTIGSGSIADIVPTRDWNTSIVRVYIVAYKTFLTFTRF